MFKKILIILIIAFLFGFAAKCIGAVRPTAISDYKHELQGHRVEIYLLENDYDDDGQMIRLVSYKVNGRTVKVPQNTTKSINMFDTGIMTVSSVGNLIFAPSAALMRFEGDYVLPKISYVITDGKLYDTSYVEILLLDSLFTMPNPNEYCMRVNIMGAEVLTPLVHQKVFINGHRVNRYYNDQGMFGGLSPIEPSVYYYWFRQHLRRRK
jgi:hypothetical protein